MSLPWYRRFRTKLVATLFPILAGVTAASIWVAERRFSDVYQRLFEAQFQTHIAAFDDARERRFEAISSKLQEIAANPILTQHLKAGAESAMGQWVEPLLQELGRQRLNYEQNAPLPLRRPGGRSPGDGEGQGGRPGPMVGERRLRPSEDRPVPPPRGNEAGDSRAPAPVLIMLLDAEGKTVARVLSNPQNGEAMRPPSEGTRQRRTAQFLRASTRPFAEVLTAQEVGYVLIEEPGESRRQVREVFVTPVRDAAGGFLGALVFGLPLPTLDERALYQQSGRLERGKIMSGVWVDGQIVSSTIPESKEGELAALMSSELQGEHTQDRGDLTLTVDGVRHRVIYRILNPESPFARAAQVNLYSLAVLDEEIDAIRFNALKLAGAAMLAAFGLVLFVSRGLSGPVSALTAATRDIAAGHYEVRVPVRTRDEVGLLGSAFNEMSAGLALRERYLSVLNAVADPAVASRLVHENAELGGRQKEVSVLFCDIRGFTALSEGLPAPTVIELLNRHMSALTSVAYEHGGTVDKFVGDQLMVLFGAPESRPDDAVRAVRCALAMRQARARLNQESSLPMEVGIGIATGQVVAGCMGSEKRLNYTVIGHRVNLAARLCGQAGAGQIVIDDATRARLPDTVEVTSLPPVRLKGISEPVQSHAVQADRSLG